METYNIDVKTADGEMDCFIAHPQGGGPFAPVILYMDVPGIRIPREEILEQPFVLKPLQDIAPDRLHPETGDSFAALWQRMAIDLPPLEVYPIEL